MFLFFFKIFHGFLIFNCVVLISTKYALFIYIISAQLFLFLSVSIVNFIDVYIYFIEVYYSVFISCTNHILGGNVWTAIECIEGSRVLSGGKSWGFKNDKRPGSWYVSLFCVTV